MRCQGQPCQQCPRLPQGPRWPWALVIPVTFHQSREAVPADGEEKLGARWARYLAWQHEENRGCDNTERKGSLHETSGVALNTLEIPAGRNTIQLWVGKVTAGVSS